MALKNLEDAHYKLLKEVLWWTLMKKGHNVDIIMDSELKLISNNHLVQERVVSTRSTHSELEIIIF